MCGIVGSFVFDNSSFRVTEPYIVEMRDTLIHRGPDGKGAWVSGDGRIGLGHRRLSILDLSDDAGQPMCTHDGNLLISFNGEIYNHAEIRAELEKEGVQSWKTDHSDTEVILYAFRQWGINCLEKFIGMFAFAIWDAKKRELWLVRDRLGIKPLYYSFHHGRVTFASEIKALLKDPDQKRAVNEESLFHYLSFLVSPAPNTMFEGIEKLPAGTWVKIASDGSRTVKQYWDVLDHTISMENLSEEEIFQQVLSEFRTSVKWRKVSDVPLGVFLSGGIDSSTNAAVFSEDQSDPVNSFCVGYEGDSNYKYKNETHFARMMADSIGAHYHERLMTCNEFIDFLPQMIRLQDEPIADPVCFPVYCVSKLAHDNDVTVCQVGEGADELFWGYPYWKLSLRLQHMNNWPVPSFLKSSLLGLMNAIGLKKSYAYEPLWRGVRGLPIFWGGAEAFTHEQKINILSPRLREKFSHITSWDALKPIYTRFKKKAKDKSYLNWMSYLDLNLRLPELLLMRVDKMSMGVSLETRVPFLDHNFVKLAMSIPEKVKTRNGKLKRVLKNAVRGVIPDAIIERKKQGFNVPIYEWLSEGLGARIREDLIDFSEKTDYFDRSEIEKLLENPKRKQLWYLENFVLWWKQYIDISSELAYQDNHS